MCLKIKEATLITSIASPHGGRKNITVPSGIALITSNANTNESKKGAQVRGDLSVQIASLLLLARDQ